jgi:hypothetical protein
LDLTRDECLGAPQGRRTHRGGGQWHEFRGKPVTHGNRQSVAIRPQGIDVTAVSITLSRQ